MNSKVDSGFDNSFWCWLVLVMELRMKGRQVNSRINSVSWTIKCDYCDFTDYGMTPKMIQPQ